MDDNQFWLTIWSLAFLAVMLLITALGITSSIENKLLHDLVDKGHDPIELSCLFNSASDSMKTPCFLIAQAKAKVMVKEK